MARNNTTRVTRDNTTGKARGKGKLAPRNKASNAWMREHVTDQFVRRAARDGLRSRASYKLKEINERDKLVKPGMCVVDLGAAPGGWSQLVAPLVGARRLGDGDVSFAEGR